MNPSELAVAIYDTHAKADEAVKTLQKAGFDMKTISIMGKGYHTEEHVTGYFNLGDRVKFFGKLGAFWGGLAGVLTGSALMFVPVVGHLIVLGPIAATIVSGIEGAIVGGGASALVGALSALGIPKDSVVRYETALKADKFLVLVNTDLSGVARAHVALGGAELAGFDHHRAI